MEWPSFSVATRQAGPIGAKACSASFTDASVSLPLSATAFSRAARARALWMSKASLSELVPASAFQVPIVCSNWACALSANERLEVLHAGRPNLARLHHGLDIGLALR